ncbi:hypothetical protein [Tenacibaculum sp. M341]|uniref:hypothetical protein n=1 Tax=Tenacibaculum sp. M341 TaxID=2530339 RepID=UPI001051CB4D|nr:hypothetical protein [Tenacibaculum sp. M341]TCI92143.1 hypothetical protein EYW44_08140 [Tenacibaculum sp. M341]
MKRVIIVLISVLFSSCGMIIQGVASGKTSIEKGAIPPDFANTDHILLCMLDGKKSVDKYMKKHVEKNYKGKYEFVTREDLKTKDKYSDKDTYRYIFESEKGYAQGQPGMGASTYSTGPGYNVYKYGIWDRIKLETYSNGVYSSYYGKLIKAYTVKMEKVRSGEL